jgi:potassium efflux system protein
MKYWSASVLLCSLFVVSFSFWGGVIRLTFAEEQTVMGSVEISDIFQGVGTLKRELLSNSDKFSGEQTNEMQSKLQLALEWLSTAQSYWNKQAEQQNLLRQSQEVLLEEDVLEDMDRVVRQSQRTYELSLTELTALVNFGDTLLNTIKQKKTSIDHQLAEFLILAKSGAARERTLAENIAEIPNITSLITSSGQVESFEVRVERSFDLAKYSLYQAESSYIKWVTNNLAMLSSKLDLKRSKITKIQSTVGASVAHLRDALHQLRQHETTQRVQDFRSERSAQNVSPFVADLRSDIANLLSENQQLLMQEGQLDDRRLVISQTIQQLEGDFERVKHLLVIGGRTERVSKILREKRSLVAASRRGRIPLLSYQESLNDLMFRIFDLEALLHEMSHVEDFLGKRVNGSSQQLSEETRKQADALVEEYRESVRALLETLRRQAGQLSELERLHASLSLTADRYENFLNKTVLWLPSDSVDLIGQYHLLFPGLLHVFSVERWSQLAAALSQQWRQNVWWLLILFGCMALRRSRHQLSQFVVEINEFVKRPSTDRWRYSLISVGASIARAAPWPACLMVVGFVVSSPLVTPFEGGEISRAFLFFGGGLFFCQVIRALLLAEGFFVKHMRWPSTVAEAINYEITWLRWLLPLSLFVGQLALASPQNEGAIAVSRLSFIVSLCIMSIFIYRIFGSKSVLFNYLKKTSSSWFSYYVFWFPVLLVTPMILLLGVVAGYYYTVIYISEKLILSAVIGFSLVVMKALCLRYLYVTKRKYHYEEAMAARHTRQRHDREAGDVSKVPGSDIYAATMSSAVSGSSVTEPQALTDEAEFDFKALSNQADRLVRMGFWLSLILLLGWYWTDLFVAVTEIDQIISGVDTGQANNATGVTFISVATGLLVAVAVIFMAKNLPGLLELVVLQRLPLMVGTKYAITTIVQYLIVLLGVVLVSRVFGIHWSNIQWLVAALSVGLGFGLQEIVANFISGIILLFEQPIRVNDVITINGVSGVVSRIRIRATTIVNWDKQEFIMPNKTFITGELTNWTLTDTLNRLVFNIGIAYGSDVEQALAILEDIACERPEVLEYPEPLITFEEFGDNALLIVGRMYLASLEDRLKIKTEINVEINRRFEQAGIVIAFPQRDIHLDTTRPLEISLKTT